MAARASGLVLEARIVDFWSGSGIQRIAIQSWLQELGFDVTVTADCVQIGVACGYVAARATQHMFAAGDAWQSVDVSDAVDEIWINLGNALLENGRVSDDYLETQHVYMLAQLFHEHVFNLPHQPWDNSSQAFPSMSWPLVVGSLDWVARGISTTLMEYATRATHMTRATRRVEGVAQPMELERAFFVTNTQWSGLNGVHWIAIAISLKYK
jgi:hypothetical protein